MNDIQNIIDRQLGFYSRLNYDNVLKRLIVYGEESFYGLQNSGVVASFNQDPPIFACRFSEAPGYENILALANEDGKVAIQDTTSAATESKMESFLCHNNAVFDLAWMPGHMNFVTVSGDHTACLWDLAEGTPKRVQIFSNHSKSVKTAAFRPTEPSVFATGARDGRILVWDVRTGNKPDNCLNNCHSSFAPKTPGSHGKRPRLEQQRATSITGLVFQDDVTLLSCGECDGNIKVWDLRKNYSAYRRSPLPAHAIPYGGGSAKRGYTNLLVDAARARLYASCMDDVIYCFNIATYGAAPERRYVGHENGTFYIKTSLSPDGNYLVSGSSDKHAYIWSVNCGESITRLAAHRAEVTCAAWGPVGDPKLVTCGDDARHMIWRVGREEIPLDVEVCGRAEIVPQSGAPARWGTLERTPGSSKRSLSSTSASTSASAKRARTQPPPARRTKRCLADLLNAAKDAENIDGGGKRAKLDNTGGTENKTGGKRPHPPENSPGESKYPPGGSTPPREWTYPTQSGAFLTPTKKYEHKTCKHLSPKNLNQMDIETLAIQSPDSPHKVRVLTFTTPTKDLPNFVLNGEAPHLRLMSPVRKKQETIDWLTLLREKRGKLDIEKPAPSPLSPREHPPRRASTDKIPKAKNTRTLLKYFAVTKDK